MKKYKKHLIWIIIPIMIACTWVARELGRPDMGGLISYEEFIGENNNDWFPLPFDERWATRTRGVYEVRKDMRDLFNINHPWTVGTEGSFGSISVTARVPADWTGGVVLYFYMSDNYQAVPTTLARVQGGWLGYEVYIGYRFKQLLINGNVVWETDVADSGPVEFAVDITEYIRPGRNFQLAFRMYDRVSTDVELEHRMDFYGSFETRREALNKNTFHTSLWIGDVVLARADGGFVREQNFSPNVNRAFEVIRDKTFPLDPIQGPFTFTDGGGIPLVLDRDFDLPRGGFPTTFGIPMPFGKVHDVSDIAMPGDAVSFGVSVTNRWHDGSIRWALVDAVITQNNYTIYPIGQPTSRPENTVVFRNDGIQVSTGQLNVTFGDYLIDYVQDANGLRLSHLRPVFAAQGFSGETTFTISDRSVTYDSRTRTDVTTTGTVSVGGEVLCRFEFRVSLYAGSGTMYTFFRYSNFYHNGGIDYKQISLLYETAQNVTELFFNEESRGEINRATVSGDFLLMQHNEVTWRSEGITAERTEGTRLEGFFGLSDRIRTDSVSVTSFGRQAPKGLRLAGDTVDIILYTDADGLDYFQVIGEAKRYEIVFDFGRATDMEDITNLSRSMTRMPRLTNLEWIAASGAMYLGGAQLFTADNLGRAQRLLTGNNRFARWSHYIASSRRSNFSIRDFGDIMFNTSQDHWSNNYYDMLAGFMASYLIGGSVGFFDMVKDAAWHAMDIDQFNGAQDSRTPMGAVYSLYTPNHNSTAGNEHIHWWAMCRHAGGWIMYYRLTGDPDARRAAKALCDFIADSAILNIVGASSRDYGGPLFSLVWGYDEFGDPRYAAAIEAIMDAMFSTTPEGFSPFLDLRRGSYVEVHGNMNYRVIVPWLNIQFAEPLYYFYRLTGSPRAAAIAVMTAESIVSEAMVHDAEPGIFFGYSASPIFVFDGPNHAYNALIVPMLGFAHRIVQCDILLASAKGGYRYGVVRDFGDPINCFWTAPSMLHFAYYHGWELDW